MALNKKAYPIITSLPFSISLFLVLAILKVKLYFALKSYTYSNGFLHDLASILFSDLVVALICSLIFYLLIRLLKYPGFITGAALYTSLIAFSTLSTITYLRLGAPINASMLLDIKYDFLKSSIEQTTDIKLLLVKLVLLIVFGLFLPYIVHKLSRNVSRKYLLSILLTLVFFSLFLFAYLKANKLGEPDLWKTPIQSFVYPIWSECKLKFYSYEGSNAFSFESPFKGKMPTASPKINLPPRNYNVIVYLMEGVPLRLMNELVSHGDMPNIEKILNRSILFTHYYPTGADSTKGMFSILTSMHPFPGHKKIIKSDTGFSWQSLPQILEKNGYRTFAISSGSFEWDHIKFFLRKHFQVVVDESKMAASKKYSKFSWGLDDQFLVDQLDTVLSRNQGPFFIILIPTNSHHPYFTSDNRFKLYPEIDLNNKLKNSICYQDNIIGKIDKVLSKHKMADDTITILTSDHSIRYDYDKGKKLGSPHISPGEDQNAIPLVIHHRTIKENSFSDIISSHVDIAPTVLNMLGLEAVDEFQGIDLFGNHNRRRVHFIISTVRNFNITLRDAEYQYYCDISNNMEAIRYKNLSSAGKEYGPEEFPIRASSYKQLCIQFIRFQRNYLEK